MSDNPSETYKRGPFYKYFGVYIILFGILHLLFGGYSLFMKFSPAYLGVKTEATLIKKETKRYRRKLIKYYFDYSFNDSAGRVIQGRNLVAKPFYLTLEDGDTFPISYLESHPEAHHIPGSSSAMMAISIFAIGLIFIIAGVIGHTMHLQREREDADERIRSAAAPS